MLDYQRWKDERDGLSKMISNLNMEIDRLGTLIAAPDASNAEKDRFSKETASKREKATLEEKLLSVNNQEPKKFNLLWTNQQRAKTIIVKSTESLRIDIKIVLKRVIEEDDIEIVVAHISFGAMSSPGINGKNNDRDK